jgi:tetrahydromethanopterin S-methyltransferase subunit G
MRIGFLPQANIGPLEKRLNDIEAKVNLLMSERE